MYAGISTAWDSVLRGWHSSYGYLEAWYGGSRLTVTDALGNPTTQLPLLESGGTNEVVVDGSAPGPRRTLTSSLARVDGLWEALEPVGTEIHAFTVLKHPSGATETVPQGVFPIDVQRMGYGPSGNTISLVAPDRWSIIQYQRFLSPRASTVGATNRAQIASLLTEALPAGLSVSDTGTSTVTVPAQTWERDRAQTVVDLAKAASLDVYFDRNGNPVIRDVPVLNPANAVWTVDAGNGGVMITADRERNRQKTYNVVVVTGQTTDGTAPYVPQVAWDNVATSLTFAGPGTGVGALTDLPAATSAGPFGQRPTFYSSPLLATAGQAQAAALTVLGRVTGLAAQLTLTAIPNGALDDGDTVLVKLPAQQLTDAAPVEVHLVDGFTVPLIPSKQPMPITTRSSRPDDVPES